VVRQLGDIAELEVRDDGVGVAPKGSQGSGLLGLAERMTEAGGALEAGPADGGGFRLVARVPIATPTAPGPEGEAQPLTTGP
jgi:two-component system, NarL family, sensor histidine kinase DesK